MTSTFATFALQISQGLDGALRELSTQVADTPVPFRRELLADIVQRHLVALTLPDYLYSGPSTLPDHTLEVQRQCFRQASDAALRAGLKPLMQGSLAIQVAGHAEESDCSLSQPLVDFFDTVLACDQLQFCDPTLPYSLVEDYCEAQVLAAVAPLFEYLECRAAQFNQNIVANRGKGLIILRVCNDLLRRTAKSQNSDFAGRVLIFLANAFPLSERSGVNVRGDFHSDNVTDYVQLPEQDSLATTTADSQAGDDKENGTGGNETENTPQPTEQQITYARLWSLQHYFANPMLLLNGPAMAKFREAVQHTLAQFQQATSTHAPPKGLFSTSAGSSSSRPAKPRKVSLNIMQNAETAEIRHDNAWNPKYLTSPSLTDLQFTDRQFRRQILVQLLIIFKYLLSFSPLAKDCPNAPPPSNKALQNSFVLEETDDTWILHTQQKVFDLLEASSTSSLNNHANSNGTAHSSNSDAFVRTVLCVLRHETNWLTWKNNNCPPYELPSMFSSLLDEYRAQQQQFIAKHAKPEISPMRFAMGTKELTLLWKLDADHLADLRSEKRRKLVPSLEPYLQEVVGMLPASTTDAPSSSLPDDQKDFYRARSWRAMRLAASSHLAQFPKVYSANYLASLQENIKALDQKLVVAAKPTSPKDAVAVE
ncbi:hypothetical protein H4R34_000263 [Dimargaris verticillata]|uniref:THO complex subunit 1 transcription elongation factor-domain-containing protein n=1 Tax=Dimargaris verticillata TaxID=2761393 RepID=A0A9W8BD11_9FUNG|nr:hypothetical protein H4R34_000263 [Dimargaris verticillata]